MKDLQKVCNEVKERIYSIEGIEEVITHYENKNYAYIRVNIKFEPRAGWIRDFLLGYLNRKMPTTVREDTATQNRDYEKEYYVIELTASGKKNQRTRKIFSLLRQLKNEIDDYITENPKLVKEIAA